MISNPFFLLSILLSTTLAFVTVAFAIESIIKIFPIRSLRARAFLRLAPFFSLITDLFFERYSIAYWINPLSCASCVQKFFLASFFPQLKDHLSQNQISLIHYLSIDHRYTMFTIIFFAFAAVTLIFGMFKVINALYLTRTLRALTKNGSLYTYPIENILLARALQQEKVKIYTSPEIHMPLATYTRAIITPQGMLDKLSKQEFEAVIAHELEHIKYNDPFLRLLYQLIATFFWWVPTQSWMKKIEQDQEQACDASIFKYRMEGASLASALVKVSKFVKAQQSLCYFANTRKPALERIHRILDREPMIEYSLFGLNFIAVALGTLFLLVCMLWV